MTCLWESGFKSRHMQHHPTDKYVLCLHLLAKFIEIVRQFMIVTSKRQSLSDQA